MPALYRRALPQIDAGLYLTDGGIETSLIFNQGLELRDFAAFELLGRPAGEAALRSYFEGYAALAARFGTGLVLESPTWRASPDWARRLGHSRRALAQANRAAIRLLEDLRAEQPALPLVISGCIGPRGDGYQPTARLLPQEARHYHQEQVDTFADTAADMVSAITMNYVEEAIGIALAAREADMPIAVSFTVETDGRLPTGQPLGEAIRETDAATAGYPSYYMVNCAHPEHFAGALAGGWTSRVRGLRANASRRSHAELNDSPELDIGNPDELGRQYAALRRGALPELNVMGGCCGTDTRHVARIAAACAPLFCVAA